MSIPNGLKWGSCVCPCCLPAEGELGPIQRLSRSGARKNKKEARAKRRQGTASGRQDRGEGVFAVGAASLRLMKHLHPPPPAPFPAHPDTWMFLERNVKARVKAHGSCNTVTCVFSLEALASPGGRELVPPVPFLAASMSIN